MLPGRAMPHATRILRHLLAECRVCRDQLDVMGWSSSRLERLVYLPGGDGPTEMPKRGNAYDYDRAFARAERIVEEFLTTPPAAFPTAVQLLEELDRCRSTSSSPSWRSTNDSLSHSSCSR